MSTGLIIAIVVVVLILLALIAFVLPRARRQAELRARERELGERRDEVVSQHQDLAGQRDREADAAERKAQLAQAEADQQRSQAKVHEQKAGMHERGLADDELIDESERDRFAPALEKRDEERAEGGRTEGGITSSPREGGRAHEPTGTDPAAGDATRSQYEQGRVDERQAGSGGLDGPSEQPPADTRRP